MTEKNNPVFQTLHNIITNDGPISIAKFMQLILFDQDHGYYQTQQPFGKDGDFLTSPEISQVFTEIIASYAIYKWLKLGKPKPFYITELGPGNGTLMADFLRVSQQKPDFYQSLVINLIEISDRLKKVQLSKLQKYDIEILHYNDFLKISKNKSFIIANEFLDCLPIYQFIKKNNQWYERMVDIINNKLAFIAVNTNNNNQLICEPHPAQDGDIYETSPTTVNIMNNIVNYISETNSTGIFVDYGYTEKSYGDTLQALKKHKYHDIFSNLGEADLTIHVDFDILTKIIKKHPSLTYQLTTQREFLINFGILQRTEQLITKNPKKFQQKITAATNRLIDPKQMGELFKVLIVNN